MSQNYDRDTTAAVRPNGLKGEDDGMPCHRTINKYGMHNIYTHARNPDGMRYIVPV